MRFRLEDSLHEELDSILASIEEPLFSAIFLPSVEHLASQLENVCVKFPTDFLQTPLLNFDKCYALYEAILPHLKSIDLIKKSLSKKPANPKAWRWLMTSKFDLTLGKVSRSNFLEVAVTSLKLIQLDLLSHITYAGVAQRALRARHSPSNPFGKRDRWLRYQWYFSFGLNVNIPRNSLKLLFIETARIAQTKEVFDVPPFPFTEMPNFPPLPKRAEPLAEEEIIDRSETILSVDGVFAPFPVRLCFREWLVPLCADLSPSGAPRAHFNLAKYFFKGFSLRPKEREPFYHTRWQRSVTWRRKRCICARAHPHDAH